MCGRAGFNARCFLIIDFFKQQNWILNGQKHQPKLISSLIGGGGENHKIRHHVTTMRVIHMKNSRQWTTFGKRLPLTHTRKASTKVCTPSSISYYTSECLVFRWKSKALQRFAGNPGFFSDSSKVFQRFAGTLSAFRWKFFSVWLEKSSFADFQRNLDLES